MKRHALAALALLLLNTHPQTSHAADAILMVRLTLVERSELATTSAPSPQEDDFNIVMHDTFMLRLDKDRNGYVSESEFSKACAGDTGSLFLALDSNRNGALDRYEIEFYVPVQSEIGCG